MAVAAYVVAGQIVLMLGVMPEVYSSPLVLIVVLVALKMGRVAGYVSAISSCLSYNFFFAVTPHYGFQTPVLPELTAYLAMLIGAHVVGRHSEPPAVRPSTRYEGALPFVRQPKNPESRDERSFWDVVSGGDWRSDCMVGQEYARIYAHRLASLQPVPPLSWIVRDMIKAGRYTGIEAGFLSSIVRTPRLTADRPTVVG